MVIDSHEHVMLPTELQIGKLDKAGVDKAILFSTTPHVERATTFHEIDEEMNSLYRLLSGNYTPQDRLENMKRTIIELKEAIAHAPERFYGFGPVPFGMSTKDTAEWIDNYIVSNSFKGIGEFTPGSKQQIEQLRSVFSVLADMPGMPIWVHTFNPVTLPGIKILMELCKEFPMVPVIWGHMGGSNWMDVIKFAKTQNNVYLDLSAAFTILSVKIALQEIPSRCLFSSDAPFGEPQLSRQLIEFVSPSTNITKMALGENICELLKI